MILTDITFLQGVKIEWLPGTIFVVLAAISAVLVFFLPETTGRALPSTINEVEAWDDSETLAQRLGRDFKKKFDSVRSRSSTNPGYVEDPPGGVVPSNKSGPNEHLGNTTEVSLSSNGVVRYRPTSSKSNRSSTSSIDEKQSQIETKNEAKLHPNPEDLDTAGTCYMSLDIATIQISIADDQKLDDKNSKNENENDVSDV